MRQVTRSGEIFIGSVVLESRRKHFGDGVVAVDCGANIGTHTVDWAKLMTGWGSVTAIEAQEQIYYALAGNVAINNCFNAKLIHAAVGDANGMMKIPQPDYLVPASFGSLELRPRGTPENIGQKIDYADRTLVPVRAITLDSLALKRVDLLKVDVEGMECEVLEGAKRTIRQSLPVIIIEHLKTGPEKIAGRPATLRISSGGNGCQHPGRASDGQDIGRLGCANDKCIGRGRTHAARRTSPGTASAIKNHHRGTETRRRISS